MLLPLVAFTACKDSKDDNPSKNNQANMEPLNFFEEEALGKWKRYHSYDGSYRYLILNGDRTACKWEKTSSGSKKSYKNYTYWKLVEKSGSSNVFDIYWGSSKDNLSTIDDFYYTKDEIRQGGYNNLIMTRTTDPVYCE